jgi:hypothetical protein
MKKKNQFDEIFKESLLKFEEFQNEEIKKKMNDSFSFVK